MGVNGGRGEATGMKRDEKMFGGKINGRKEVGTEGGKKEKRR